MHESNMDVSQMLLGGGAISRNTGRSILLFTEVTGASESVIAGFLDLQIQSPTDDITFMINSDGGSIDDMVAIIDVMNILKCDVKTVCVGRAMSAGAVLLICGSEGKRFMTENSRIMLHSVSGGALGTAHDIDIEASEIKRINDHMCEMIAQRSNLTVDEVKTLTNRDRYIMADEALEMGLVDGIITTLK